jgi:DNA-binding NarL/FixJ family response regulator
MRILIVEDEALVAMEIESMVAMAGHEAIGQADDLDSTMAAIATQRPDVALVDIQLAQGCSGIDVAAALMAQGIPVVFATGNCISLDRSDIALGCLQKPITDRALATTLAVIAAVLNGQPLPPLHQSLRLFVTR